MLAVPSGGRGLSGWSRWVCERGTATVTTITVSVVLLATMMVVQFALAYYSQQVLSGAAQDGAVAGARRDSTPEAGRDLALDLVDQAGSSLLLSHEGDVVVGAEQVVVTLRGEVVSLIPFRRSILVEASGSAPLERFRPQEVGS